MYILSEIAWLLHNYNTYPTVKSRNYMLGTLLCANRTMGRKTPRRHRNFNRLLDHLMFSSSTATKLIVPSKLG